MTTLVRSLSGTALGRALPALIGDLASDPELAAEFRRRIFDARRATTAATLQSAIEHGEIRFDIDLDFVLDALASPLYYRVFFGHLPLTERVAEQAVDGVLTGIRREPGQPRTALEE